MGLGLAGSDLPHDQLHRYPRALVSDAPKRFGDGAKQGLPNITLGFVVIWVCHAFIAFQR